MKPPSSGDNIPADTTTDELIARVIPLRHRAAEPPQPHSTDERAQPNDATPPRKHSVWDPSSGEPLLRRRTVPAATAPASAGRSPARRVPARAINAAIAGVAAITATVAVLLGVGALHSQPGSATRSAGALGTGTATPASTSPGRSTRPHPSSQHSPAAPTAYERASPMRHRAGPPAPAATATLSAPARTSAPAQAPSREFSFER